MSKFDNLVEKVGPLPGQSTLLAGSPPHPSHVEGWTGTPEGLAAAIGQMRYDKVCEFLALLVKEIAEQSSADAKKSRPQLSACLHKTATHLTAATVSLSQAWKICSPHM